MSKAFKRIMAFVLATAMLMGTSVSTLAAENEQPKKWESLSETNLEEFSQYIFNVEDSDIMLIPSAPALTQFYLYEINSEKAGTEMIDHSSTTAQVGSKLDHGGTWFQAITIEVGYAKTRFAYFNNMNMTLTDT